MVKKTQILIMIKTIHIIDKYTICNIILSEQNNIPFRSNNRTKITKTIYIVNGINKTRE